MKVSIDANIPDYFNFFYSCGEDKFYLDNDIPIELDVPEGTDVILSQDENISMKEKVLTALIAFITVPFQVALLLVERDWEKDIIPYRFQVKINATANTKCTLCVKRPEKNYHTPHISVIGDNITYEVVKAVPWVKAFDIACYRFMCKVAMLILLTATLLGTLAAVTFFNGLQTAFVVIVVTLVALLGYAAFIIIHNVRKCTILKEQFLLNRY